MTMPDESPAHSRWKLRVDDDTIAAFGASGAWTGVTLANFAAARVTDNPDAIAVIDGERGLSFGTIVQQAGRLALALSVRGLVPGDVISFQLPNWFEAAVINLAAAFGGFVCNPIVPIYRSAEVGFILRDASAKAIFIPEQFRSTNYLEMLEALRPELPELAHIFLVRSARENYETFDTLCGERSEPLTLAPPSANLVKLLLYTSGTTGRPKGVLHTHNTLGAEIDAVAKFWSVTAADRIFMPSPVTHITGYLYALELPFATGAATILMEQWTAEEAVRLIDGHRGTLTVGATPFLVELSAAARRYGTTLPTLRLFACGGAPVATETILEAAAALPRCTVARIFGCSEAPTITLGVGSGDERTKGATTDGKIANNDVRIVDLQSGIPLGVEREGEIVVRGPEVMVGYTDPLATDAAFDQEGFFHTGDLGFVDHDGFITVSGRKKDLIIRGGENLSPKEIEDALILHPEILEAAVVATPHDRLGETVMAYLIASGERRLSQEELRGHLDCHGLARQKFPERVEYLEEFPRTASGKVLKHILRARASATAP